MKNYLFITHFTPEKKASPLRTDLNHIYINALKAQTYSNWNALILSDFEKKEDKLNFVLLEGGSKEELNISIAGIYEREDVKKLIDQADYIIKLDDDDVISSTLLERISKLDFDCYCDEYHTFYDLTSGIITQQKRPWIASTCVHSKKHAFAEYKGEGYSVIGNLLYSDHSKAWHNFYKDKKIIKEKKEHPVYLRILSPTSITAGQPVSHDKNSGSFIYEKYDAYLEGFGNWFPASVNGFDKALPALKKAWLDFSGKPLRKFELRKDNFFKRQIKKITGNGK